MGSDPLAPYKNIIDDCMYPDIYSKKPIQISKAKKAISNYSKAVGDPVGEVELMVFFVERGNSFTLNFGDMDEDFYDALNRMYQRVIKKVLYLPQEYKKTFQKRLKNILMSSSGMGWGYHDMLYEDYYSAFPE
ncbi:MAG: hypothetical protein C4530_17315 [Desulfobacteraceae bacterium]|nr:MAG: hypothetical protein C4530_17315 [Desulfobacteraceae bacterium]